MHDDDTQHSHRASLALPVHSAPALYTRRPDGQKQCCGRRLRQRRRVLRHVLPNVLAPIIVIFSMTVGGFACYSSTHEP
jgi:hypothetical protein